LRNECVEFLLVPVRHDDSRAFTRESCRYGATQRAGATGDQRDFIFEAKFWCH
jgi:hypothetical protein